MAKTTKTAAELEAMILDRMKMLSQCPDGMTVAVERRGASWEVLLMSPNDVPHADRVIRMQRYAAVLRKEYALAD